MTDFTIDTDRLHLRPREQKDVAEVFRIARANPDLTKFMTWETPEKIEETQQWFDSVQKKFPEKTVTWAITFKEKFIGVVSLENITRWNQKLKIDSAELGYWLDPAFHRKSIMPETAHAVMQFGFETLNLHKITCAHFVQNLPSQKVIEKLGFRCVGTQKKECLYQGEWWDHKIYELLKEDFQK